MYKRQKGDSIRTLREKTQLLTNAIRCNAHLSDIDRTQYTKNLVRYFLSEDQSWIQDLATIILEETTEQSVLWDQSNRIITPDEIERWLKSMWELRWTLDAEEHRKKDEEQRSEINRDIKIQHNDSHDEVRWKIHTMLRRLEDSKGETIICGDIDNRHRDDIIHGLRSILSTNDSWMPHLQAIAAEETHTPDALQPGSQLPLSYQGIQNWAMTMWTNRSGDTLLRKVSSIMSSFQHKPPTDQEASNKDHDIAGTVRVTLPVRRGDSQETELASVDISPLLANLRLAEIEARKLGRVLFQEKAKIPKDNVDGAPTRSSDTAGANREIAKIQSHLEEGTNARIEQATTAEPEEPDYTTIQRVKEIVYNRAFQEKDAAFRPTTPQATLIIEKNQKALQDEETRGECGRTRCTNRSKCFKNRYRSQKYTNNLYLLCLLYTSPSPRD